MIDPFLKQQLFALRLRYPHEVGGRIDFRFGRHILQTPGPSAPDDDSVVVDECPFSYHTHPDEAYRKHQAVYGYPSATDMTNFVFSSMRAHYVVSREGMYVITDRPGKTRLKRREVQGHLRELYNAAKATWVDPATFAAFVTENNPWIYVRFEPWSF